MITTTVSVLFLMEYIHPKTDEPFYPQNKHDEKGIWTEVSTLYFSNAAISHLLFKRYSWTGKHFSLNNRIRKNISGDNGIRTKRRPWL